MSQNTCIDCNDPIHRGAARCRKCNGLYCSTQRRNNGRSKSNRKLCITKDCHRVAKDGNHCRICTAEQAQIRARKKIEEIRAEEATKPRNLVLHKPESINDQVMRLKQSGRTLLQVQNEIDHPLAAVRKDIAWIYMGRSL